MSMKLSWGEIKERFRCEWVELVDYEWDEMDLHPLAGIVRVHAQSREEFNKLISNDPPKDSAYIFVGDPAANQVISADLHLFTTP